MLMTPGRGLSSRLSSTSPKPDRARNSARAWSALMWRVLRPASCPATRSASCWPCSVVRPYFRNMDSWALPSQPRLTSSRCCRTTKRAAGRARAMPMTSQVMAQAPGVASRRCRLSTAVWRWWASQPWRRARRWRRLWVAPSRRGAGRGGRRPGGRDWVVAPRRVRRSERIEHVLPRDLDGDAVAQGHDRAGHALDEGDVMGGHQHGDPHLVELLEEVHDLCRQLGVQVAGGLVGQQQGWLVDHGPGDANPLLFSPREGDGRGLFLVQQPDLVQGCAHPAAHFPGLEASDEQRQGDVVEHAAVKQQLVVLKDDPDVAAVPGNAARAQPGDVLLVDDDLSGAGPLHGHDQLQQSALAGARVTGEEHHVASFQLEAQAPEGLMAPWVALVHLVEADHGGLPSVRGSGEQGLDELLGDEGPQVIDLFADADKANGQPQLLADGKDDAALGGAIELGQGDARYPHRLLEVAGLAESVLACARVEHQQDFVGRFGSQLLHDPDHLLQLLHEVVLVVQPACGIGDEHVEVAGPGRLEGIIDDRGAVGSGVLGDDRHPVALAPDLQQIG